MKKTVLSILLIQLLFFTSCGNHNDNNDRVVIKSDTLKRIDDYLENLSKKSFSGGLLIIKSGEKIFSKGYGFADKEKNIPFTPSTLASMGSITKAFTAAAIMKLYEQGKLLLSDSLEKYFPGVPADKAGITIHQLLTHSSGFSEFTKNDQGDYQHIETAEYLTTAFSEPLLFKPGTKAIYTNVGMSILGIIIEKITGMDYEKFLRKELFGPNGILHIGYQYPPDSGVAIAHGYRQGKDWGTHLSHFEKVGGGPYWNLKANGGLEASLNDMYLWANAFTNSTILKDSTIRKMFTPHIVEENTNGHYFFGYGCNISKSRRNTTVIDNGGSNGIYFARLIRLPQEGIVMYMVTNESTMPAEKILPNVTQLYFTGAIKQDYLSTGTNQQAKEIHDLLVAKGPGNFEQDLKDAGITMTDDMILLDAGQMLTAENKTNEAIALYEYYIKAFPNIVVAQNDLADLYLLKGEKDKAILHYREALRLRPGNQRAINSLSKLGIK